MIDYKQLQAFAASLLASARATEVEIRRAVSAAYYGLFHRLAADGASVFGAGGSLVSSQVARAYAHTTMLDVCRAFQRFPRSPLPSPLDQLLPAGPDQRLIEIARAFVVLQDARHRADYNVLATVSYSDGLDALARSALAHSMLDQVTGLPETEVFLAALLLHDRWKRRG